MASPVIETDKCIGCGKCMSVCPAEPNVFMMKDDKSGVVHPESCIECGACVANCPVQCITLQ
ncbi:MAG: 4Fe-4S binding protein [Candidatus Muiribacteriaceae bacterium]